MVPDSCKPPALLAVYNAGMLSSIAVEVFVMFSSGSKIDLKQIEEEARRLFTPEELEELKQLELNLIPNPDRIRPFFHQDLTFPDLKKIRESLAHNPFFDSDYNIDLNTFLASS